MREFGMLERIAYHVNRRTARKEVSAQYARARHYSRRFQGSGHLPCGYQDSYGDRAEQECVEARAMGIAYMIWNFGGCKRFGEICARMADDWGAA